MLFRSLLKRSARSELASSLSAVGRGEQPVATVAHNPRLFSSGTLAALPSLLSNGFDVDAGQLYFREPGVLFRVALRADRDLLCLVQGLVNRVIYCADTSKQSVAS